MISEEKKQKFLKMSPEDFDKYMCETYPKIFRQRNMPMNQTCMCWGFNIGKGWYAILDNLCEKLDFISKISGVNTIFVQIKEKFGGARYYYQLECSKENENTKIYIDIIETLINSAERKSDYACAECGEFRDKMISVGGWVYDVCKKCFPKVFPDRKEMLEDYNKKQEIWEELENAYYYANDKEIKEFVKLQKKVSKRIENDRKKMTKEYNKRK